MYFSTADLARRSIIFDLGTTNSDWLLRVESRLGIARVDGNGDGNTAELWRTRMNSAKPPPRVRIPHSPPENRIRIPASLLTTSNI